MRTYNRWVIAAAGVLMQVALGAVYAWSMFRAPLVRQFGWSISAVTLMASSDTESNLVASHSSAAPLRVE